MELIKSTPKFSSTRSLASFSNPQEVWEHAYTYVTAHRKEMLDNVWSTVIKADWGRNVTEHYFMREYTWCVHVSGFSARVISKKFDDILRVHNIEDVPGHYVPITSDNIITDFSQVYAVYKNKNKAKAIQAVRQIILQLGWPEFMNCYVRHGEVGPTPETLQRLPFLGPALSCHIARNLGNQDAVKPDLHLVRLAEKYHLSSVTELCQEINESLGLTRPLGYIDLVLWIASVDHGTT